MGERFSLPFVKDTVRFRRYELKNEKIIATVYVAKTENPGATVVVEL